MLSLLPSSKVDFSPISLSYIGALRGVRPRLTAAPFAYAQVVGDDIDSLLCLAASNPEGRFFGFASSDTAAAAAQNIADQRQALNVSFIATPLQTLAEKIEKGSDALPPLDYLVADATTVSLNDAQRTALYDIAAKKLRESGLFCLRYASARDSVDLLRFLINDVSADLSVEQANEWLPELKNIASRWIGNHPNLAQALDQAIAKAVPDLFFSELGSGTNPFSGAFSVMENMLPRGFSFVGDAVPANNYLELSTGSEAHASLLKSRDSLYYELLKDLAMNRTVRTDIWSRMPVAQTSEGPLLFGGFAYGTTIPRNEIPGSATVFNKFIDLTTPLFSSLLDVMTILPLTIGDFLHHPKGQGYSPAEIIEALQVLVALDIAKPMRSGSEVSGKIDTGSPKWALVYNAYHNVTPITTSRVRFASKIVGCAVDLSARDALVLQAISRVGLSHSAGAVFLEMQRIAQDPVLANEVMNTTSPTPEMADSLTREVVESSLVRWYAYGLLAA